MVVVAGLTYRIEETAVCVHCDHLIHRGSYIASGVDTGWTHHFGEDCPPLTKAEPSERSRATVQP